MHSTRLFSELSNTKPCKNGERESATVSKTTSRQKQVGAKGPSHQTNAGRKPCHEQSSSMIQLALCVQTNDHLHTERTSNPGISRNHPLTRYMLHSTCEDNSDRRRKRKRELPEPNSIHIRSSVHPGGPDMTQSKS